MKIFVTAFLLSSSLSSVIAVAEGTCATEQCVHAQAIPELPADVREFVDRRDGCDHFRGEPWDEGEEPEVRGRREFIFQNLKKLCTGTDARLKALRDKYRSDRRISELLKEYEDEIEFH